MSTELNHRLKSIILKLNPEGSFKYVSEAEADHLVDQILRLFNKDTRTCSDIHPDLETIHPEGHNA